MSEISFDTPLYSDPSPGGSCRSQHQYWTAIIVRNEQEIDQLLLFLMDLPEQRNPRSLNYQAKYYYSDLVRIKKVFQCLRLDLICEQSACGTASSAPCRKYQSGLYTSMAVDSQLRALADELVQIKARCSQFC
jgi:hypothetical protein